MSDLEASAPGRRVLVIVNPTAHNLPGRKRLKEVDRWLREHGWRTEWAETAQPGDATRLAEGAAGQGVPLVLVCGGDGSLREAVNGLAGSETAMGVIPAGLSNLWAREIDLPARTLDAVRLQATGERRRIDLGRAGSRYFLLMAGYGMDGQVTRRVSPRTKGRMGAAAYLLAALREGLTYRSRPVQVRLNGNVERADVFMALVGNTQRYAGLTRVTPDAKVDDGLLDVCIYEGRGRLDIVLHTVRTLLGRHRGSRKVVYRKARRIEFSWERPLPLQLDGDPMDESPAEVTVAPGALWVAVPRAVKTPIFSDR